MTDIKTVADGDEAQRPLSAQQGRWGWILSPFAWRSLLDTPILGSKVEVRFARVGGNVGPAKATITLAGHYVDLEV
jgi:hypothetical protein